MDRSHRWLDHFDPNSAYAKAMGEAVQSEYARYSGLPLDEHRYPWRRDDFRKWAKETV